MGTQINLVFYATNQTKADSVSTLVFKKIDALNEKLSDYIEDSELNRLGKKSQVDIDVSADLYHILKSSIEISERTDGAFDITVGPLIKIWRKSRETKVLPLESELINAKSKVGYRFILFPKENTVRFEESEMKLDLGGIGKGFAADEVLKLLDTLGIKSALVDMGGDISVSDAPPEKDYWTLGFSYFDTRGTEVFQKVRLKNQAIATSGDLYQHVEINGHRYSHIIDPRTGMALDNGIQATVIAPTATLADAYASAFSVMGIAKAKLFVKVLSQLEFFLSESNQIQHLQWQSDGFSKYMLQY